MQDFKTEFDTSPSKDFKSEFESAKFPNFKTEFENTKLQNFNAEFNTSPITDFKTEFNSSPIADFKAEFESVVTSAVREEKQEKSVVITENGTYEVVPDLNKVLKKVTITADIIGGDVEEYKGSYEVTPQVEEQTLSTARKVMRNDMKIKKIPYFETSNNSGGNTVFIGSEV